MTQLTPTAWSANPDALVNVYVYDSASIAYDSASKTYDGIVPSNLDDTTKVPTSWSSL